MPSPPAVQPSPKLVPPTTPAVPGHSALDLLDEAFHRLRLAPAGVLGIYYAGTLPFVLALLYFWADQSRSPDAARHATGAALLVVALFVGMKIAHAVFTARLTEGLRRAQVAPWTWARLGRLAFVQGVIQPPGLFVLNLALALVVPSAWVYAFYQNVTVFGDGSPGSVQTTFRRAWRGAQRRSKQNHAGLTILSLLSLFVILNVLTAVVALPYGLRMFTGEENLITRSGLHLLNTTFFAIIFGLVYLVLDPLAKAFYTLRCFYDESLRTGEDLLGDLAALPAPAAAVSALAAHLAPAPGAPPANLSPAVRPRPPVPAGTLLVLLAGAACLLLPVQAAPASAMPPVTGTPPVAAPPPRSVSPPQLGRSIADVLQRRQFAWRLPRPEDQEAAAEGPFDAFLETLKGWARAAGRTLLGWLEAFLRWWHPHRPLAKPPAGLSPFDADTWRSVLIGLAALLGGAILYLGWRQWRGRRAPVVAGRAVPTGSAAPPDLAADDVLATQLPEDEWLRLAQTLLQNGERRLALRAFYLSALASLAARGLLAIARHKSNRDYLLELRRRAREQPELQGAFGRVVGRFERVWYGSHPADDVLLAEFQSDRQKVLD